MRILPLRLLLVLGLAAVAAVPGRKQHRIVGGTETTINNYPSIASLLYTWDFDLYQQLCAGIIINARSILTAAQCPSGDTVNRWRVRVGSTYANSGGTIYRIQDIIIHHSYNALTRDNDIAIMRTASVIMYSHVVQAGRIAGASYNLSDDQEVWAAGWGAISYQGSSSEQLRHVQVWTINQDTCAERYLSIRKNITDNMLCSGWLDVGGRDQCRGDSGGPLYHNGVVVGIFSWSEECAHAHYPGVNTRVSRYTTWVQANA